MEEETDTQQGRSSPSVMYNDAPDEYADDPDYTATQLVMDPRRLGEHNSGLSDQDLADIYCILHPASFSAYKETALMAKRTPQHTISSSGMPARTHRDVTGNRDPSPEFDLASQGIVSSDIALRLSAQLKDPLLGFVFGRNARRCDLVLGETDTQKRISNVHFRIYFDENGTLMVLDQSTNGTLIEGHLLCGGAKFKAKGLPDKHTLENGTVISFPSNSSTEELKFIVRIPQRDEIFEDLYRQNLADYFDRRYALRQKEVEAKAAALAAGNTVRAGTAPDIFARHTVSGQPLTTSSLGRYGREWRGGSKYSKVRIIGKGAFANVYMITTKYDGTPFAAKELEKRRFMKNGVLDQRVENEIKIMSVIQHPNIVKYVEYVNWDEYLYLILEYVPNGDLGSLIPKHGVLPETQTKLMAIQLLSALKYLHNLGITHRDVKPDNILIQSYNPIHVKLTDFGLSKMIENDDTNLRTFCGTLMYCAPEVYSEYREYDNAGKRTKRGKHALPPQKYDQAVDLWSFAGVLFYAMSGKPPFAAPNGAGYQELLHKIMTQPLDTQPLRNANISDEGAQFVQSILNIHPEARPSIEELENSAWLKPELAFVSLDSYDEGDMAKQNDEIDLEQSASQLSLQERTNDELLESLDNSLEDVDELLAQKGELPNGLASDDSLSHVSYTFLRNTLGKEKPRLFGEVAVNASAIGSSDFLPNQLLNLPTFKSNSSEEHSQFHNSYISQKKQSKLLPKTEEAFDNISASIARQGMQGFNETVNVHDPGTAPSLLGAEALVDQMQMSSPSPTHLENFYADSRNIHDRVPLEVRDDMSASLPLTFVKELELERQNQIQGLDFDASHSRRHSRDETEELNAANKEQAALKRLKGQDGVRISASPKPTAEKGIAKCVSARDLRGDLVAPSVFWNPRDKSSHHYNYPQITIEEYNALLAEAKLRGENLYPGEKSFEELIAPYRMSRSPSVEPESWYLYPPEEALRPEMLRDERRLSEVFGEGGVGNQGTPRISGPSLLDPRARTYHDSFRAPLRILAKLSSTSNSAVQVPTINIMDPVTSWGRGSYNTHVYPDKANTKVPKYAFKLVLWNPHMDTTKSFKEQLDLNFWISTKASCGIWINDILLPSHEPTQHDQVSVSWAQLRQGDIITVWKSGKHPKARTEFRFECNYSSSQSIRAYGSKTFKLLPRGRDQQNIDNFCLCQERENWAAKGLDYQTTRITNSVDQGSHQKDKNKSSSLENISRESSAAVRSLAHH